MAHSGQANLNKQFGVVRIIDDSTFNVAAGVTGTLDRLDSGTHFNIDGTGDVQITLPALSTDNVGVNYTFLLTTAQAGGTTTTFVLPGSGVSNFHGMLTRMSGSGNGDVNVGTTVITTDVAGDTLTLPNSTAVGARVDLLCLTDDGTNSVWKAEVYTPAAIVATIA